MISNYPVLNLPPVGYPKILREQVPGLMIFNTLPGEPVIREDLLSSYYMDKTNPPSRIRPAFSEFLSRTNDTCWSVIFSEGCFPKEIYYEGLGGPYGSCSGLFDGNTYLKKLVYYKKDEEGHGTPLFINVGTEKNNPVKSTFTLQPNPVKSDLVIFNHSGRKDRSFVLTNIEGKKVLYHQLTDKQTRLSLEHLESGLYIYRIFSDKELIQTGRIIKE